MFLNLYSVDSSFRHFSMVSIHMSDCFHFLFIFSSLKDTGQSPPFLMLSILLIFSSFSGIILKNVRLINK